MLTGRVLDGDGRPVARQLVEIWQANAAGRYVHQRDQHPAPLDPNFTGAGRALTDDDGCYRFTTIKPGPYPWRNHRNAWRPAHIHFSLFGTEFTQRLITQMYFPGDPLFPLDPIFQSIPDPTVRERLVAAYDHDLTELRLNRLPLGHRLRPGANEPDRRTGGPVSPPRFHPRPGRPSARSSATRCRTMGQSARYRPDTPRPSDRTGTSSTATAHRCPTPCSRSGRRRRQAMIEPPPGSLRRDGYTFTGWGRVATDNAGDYLHHGRTGPHHAGQAAVHRDGRIRPRVARSAVHPRVYLPDDAIALAADPLLTALPPDRRTT